MPTYKYNVGELSIINAIAPVTELGEIRILEELLTVLTGQNRIHVV
jgi:hypothetical protein